MRVRPEDVTLLKPEQVPISGFKPQDKKQLLENFLADERVQLYMSKLLAQKTSQVPDQAVVNMDINDINSLSFTADREKRRNLRSAYSSGAQVHQKQPPAKMV